MSDPVEQKSASQAEGAGESTQAAAEATPADEIPFKDPETAEIELRLSKDILAMPEEV